MSDFKEHFGEYISDDEAENAAIYLLEKERSFLTGEHPEAAWEVMVFCIYKKHIWPPWVDEYLGNVAKNIVLSKRPEKKDKTFLAKALGGLDNSILNAMWRETRATEVYIEIEKLIAEGRKTEAARRQFSKQETKKSAAEGYKVTKTEARQYHKKVQAEVSRWKKREDED